MNPESRKLPIVTFHASVRARSLTVPIQNIEPLFHDGTPLFFVSIICLVTSIKLIFTAVLASFVKRLSCLSFKTSIIQCSTASVKVGYHPSMNTRVPHSDTPSESRRIINYFLSCSQLGLRRFAPDGPRIYSSGGLRGSFSRWLGFCHLSGTVLFEVEEARYFVEAVFTQ